MLVVENKTWKIQLSSNPTNFRITTVKTYLQESPSPEIPVLENSDVSESDLGQLAEKFTNDDNGDNINTAELLCRNPAYTHRLPTKFQNTADIFIFLILKSNFFQSFFTESKCKKINRLLEKCVFELVIISDIPNRIRIFNLRFIDKIKNQEIITTFKKSRLIVQAHNNHDKEKNLTQSPTI